MADKKHPILGGLFLMAAVGIIGVGAYTGVTQSQAHVEADQEEVRKRVQQSISDAIQLGQLGDIDRAVRMLRLTVERDPNNIDAIYNLGVALVGQGQADQAHAMFRRVLELAPGDSEATAELAAIKKDKGDLDGAFALLSSIAPRAGKITLRLDHDDFWDDVSSDPRMIALREKHGLKPAREVTAPGPGAPAQAVPEAAVPEAAVPEAAAPVQAPAEAAASRPN